MDPETILDKVEPSTNGHAESAAPSSLMDVSTLRMSQDFAASLGVKKEILTVPVRKPSREWFVQTHPSADYRIQTGVIELKEDRETYLVSRELWPELATTEATFGTRAIFTAVNRQGVVFLWPIRLPGPDGKIDEWNNSALEAAQLAMGHWVRIAANMSLGAYDVFQSTAMIAEPQWPDLSFQQLIDRAFKNKFVDRLDHPVLTRLRGET